MNKRQIFLATAISVFFGTMAQAGESVPPPGNPASKAVYEGVDAKGRFIRLTISDLNVETFSRVHSENRPEHSVPHWSSLIGTGAAAQAERNP
jgi:hypothetical protein